MVALNSRYRPLIFALSHFPWLCHFLRAPQRAFLVLIYHVIISIRSLTEFSFNQVTVVQGDAADEQTIQDLVSRAVKEEGRLDVFFANVSSHMTLNPPCTLNINFVWGV